MPTVNAHAASRRTQETLLQSLRASTLCKYVLSAYPDSETTYNGTPLHFRFRSADRKTSASSTSCRIVNGLIIVGPTGRAALPAVIRERSRGRGARRGASQKRPGRRRRASGSNGPTASQGHPPGNDWRDKPVGKERDKDSDEAGSEGGARRRSRRRPGADFCTLPEGGEGMFERWTGRQASCGCWSSPPQVSSPTN